MLTFSLSLLGSFSASFAEMPLTKFRTNKAQALLTYLVVENKTFHQRDTLMTLLWPGLPQKSAQINLRQVLYQVNKLVPQKAGVTVEDEDTAVSLLISDRKRVELNPEYPIECDVTQFSTLLQRSWQHNHENVLSCPHCLAWLEEAIALYRGDFLADFSLYDSSNYEAWAQVKRETLRRQMLDTLDTLTQIYMAAQNYQAAEQTARRQLEIDNLRENSYRQLMEILALTERRNEAIALFEECQRLLLEELGMAPSAKTAVLCEQIKGGSLNFVAPMRQGIRGYELGEKIGEGAFGSVYKAFQKGIEREVAIKIIHPQYANQPRFIRRFEAEAQIIAQLEHPHIVPLYDYWREPDGAFLVMRWLRGGSLQTALEKELFPLETTVAIITQIASALQTAHTHGIVHRDVKPGNILLDEENNAYLADFGIARNTRADMQQSQSNALIGSPAYISPEQLLGEEVTPATDIYCLGLVLYTLLTGESPYTTTSIVELMTKQINDPLPLLNGSRQDLPAHIDDVLQKATAKKPGERFQNAVAFAEALQQTLMKANGALVIDSDQQFAAVAEADMINPYKGLHAFQEQDAAHFYGRTALIEQLLSCLTPSDSPHASQAEARFLAIVGPSGSGKSSVVKAGLIPAVRQGALPGSQDWFIVQMTPGSYPLEELEAALLNVAVDPPPSLLEPLQKDARGLVRVLKRLLPQDRDAENPSQLLLVIDQFEELFTLTESEEERIHFLENLLTALTEAHSRLWVIVTLRADFYDRPLQFPQLGEWLRQRTELVLPLTTSELEQAITMPAANMGVTLEPGLVSAIMVDVKEQPGALPLLQYALTELFERRNGRNMTLAAYEEIGGVTGALARRADEIYAGLETAAQEATRQLFLRLVTLGEGIEDTRRRVLQSELVQLDNSQQLTGNNQQSTGGLHPSSFIIHNLDLFGRYRLLTFDRDPITREPTVEVAHEALIREWELLKGWLREGRADIRLQRLLATATHEWVTANQDAGYLLRGARLDLYQDWMNKSDVALTQDEATFLELSLAARSQRILEEEARRQRELETAQQLAKTERHRAEEQERASQKLRRRAIYLGIALLLMIFLSAFAFLASRQSNINAQQAEANLEMAVTSESAALHEAVVRTTAQAEAEVERENAIVAEATSQALAVAEADQRATAEAEAVIRITAEAQALAERQDALVQASIGLASQAMIELDGKFPERAIPLALTALEDYPYTWQAERALGQAVLESRLEFILEGHTRIIQSAAWSPDGRTIATAGYDQTAKLWNGRTGQELFTLSGHEDRIYYLVWSPLGNKLATTSFDGTVRVWDTSSGAAITTLPHALPYEGRIYRAAWSPDGTQIVTASRNGTAKVWDAATGELIYTLLEDSETPLFSVAWSPDGTQIVTGDFAGVTTVWEAATGDQLFTLDGHSYIVSQISWSPTEEQILTASWDNTARIWDAENGELQQTLEGHTGWVPNALWSPTGEQIATSSEDASVRIWDAEGGEVLHIYDPGDLTGDSSYPNYLTWSPGGNMVATNRFDGSIVVIDTKTGGLVYDLTGHTALILALDWSPDGNHLLTAGLDATARVWDVAPRGETLSMEDPISGYGLSDWSSDGQRFVTTTFDGAVQIWDTESWEEIFSFHEPDIWSILWDTTGSKFGALTFNGEVKVFNAKDGALLQQMEIAPNYGGLDWAPNDSQLAAGDMEGIVRIWDGDSGELLHKFEGHDGNRVNWVDWSPDGKLMVSSDVTNRALIWEVDSGNIVQTLQDDGYFGEMTIAIWSPDGTQVASYSKDSVGGRVWEVSSGNILTTFTGHSESVWSLQWSQLGDRLLTGSGDATARLWDAQTGAELLVYTLPDWVVAYWSPDNQRIAIATGDGTVWVKDVHWHNVDELIAYARECCLIRPLTPEEEVQFGLRSEE